MQNQQNQNTRQQQAGGRQMDQKGAKSSERSDMKQGGQNKQQRRDQKH